MSTQVALPCGCDVAVNTEMFKSGERGVWCPRHEREFTVAAVPQRLVHYEVVAETTKPKEVDE